MFHFSVDILENSTEGPRSSNSVAAMRRFYQSCLDLGKFIFVSNLRIFQIIIFTPAWQHSKPKLIKLSYIAVTIFSGSQVSGKTAEANHSRGWGTFFWNESSLTIPITVKRSDKPFHYMAYGFFVDTTWAECVWAMLRSNVVQTSDEGRGWESNAEFWRFDSRWECSCELCKFGAWGTKNLASAAWRSEVTHFVSIL